MPLLDQTLDISLRSMKRNPTHRRTLLKPAVLTGQCQLQLLGHQQRILKKHLIKIAQAVEQNTVFVGFLCLAVFLHHR